MDINNKPEVQENSGNNASQPIAGSTSSNSSTASTNSIPDLQDDCTASFPGGAAPVSFPQGQSQAETSNTSPSDGFPTDGKSTDASGPDIGSDAWFDQFITQALQADRDRRDTWPTLPSQLVEAFARYQDTHPEVLVENLRFRVDGPSGIDISRHYYDRIKAMEGPIVISRLSADKLIEIGVAAIPDDAVAGITWQRLADLNRSVAWLLDDVPVGRMGYQEPPKDLSIKWSPWIQLPGCEGMAVWQWLKYNSPDDLKRILNQMIALPCVVYIKAAGKNRVTISAGILNGKAMKREVNPTSTQARNTYAGELSKKVPDVAQYADAILDLAVDSMEVLDRTPTPDFVVDPAKQPPKFDKDDVKDRWMAWIKGDKKVMLTNFVARILADVVVTDGVSEERQYRVSVRDGRPRSAECLVPADRFNDMDWLARLGSYYQIYHEVPRADSLVADAIRSFSETAGIERQYTHTGWIIDDKSRRCFLTASGAMTADGLDTSIKTTTAAGDDLDRYRLVNPPAGQELAETIRKTLGILRLSANKAQIWPIIGTVYLAPVMDPDYSTFATGETGSFKTSVMRIVMAHMGVAWCDCPLPTFKNGTALALQYLTFRAANVPLLVDDYRRPSTRSGTDRATYTADQVFQNAADRGGRVKLNSDGTPVAVRPARCALLSNGEDIIPGHSTTARMLIIPYGKGDIDTQVLTACQKDASDGVYVRAYSGYIRWVAANYDSLVKQANALQLDLRKQFHVKGDHGRIAENLSQAMTGCWLYLGYALAVRAITQEEFNQHYNDALNSLKTLANTNREELKDADTVEKFIAGLNDLLLSGRGHITRQDGSEPTNSGRLGWRQEQRVIRSNSGLSERLTDVGVPQGLRIGVIDKDGNLCIWLKVAIEQINRNSNDDGRLTISDRQLGRQLRKADKIITDGSRNVRQVKVCGIKDYCTVIKAAVLNTPPQPLIAPLDDSDSQEQVVQPAA